MINICNVICKQLGYNTCDETRGVANNNNDFPFEDVGAGTGPIWMDNIVCDGTESQIANCQHAGWGQHNCNHNEDITIRCSGYIGGGYISNICLNNNSTTSSTNTSTNSTSFVPVVKTMDNAGCGKQIKNLGTVFTWPEECMAAAYADNECYGDEIMWSDGYNYAWGCRCCAPGSGYGNYNQNWDVYSSITNPNTNPDVIIVEEEPTQSPTREPTLVPTIPALQDPNTTSMPDIPVDEPTREPTQNPSANSPISAGIFNIIFNSYIYYTVYSYYML